MKLGLSSSWICPGLKVQRGRVNLLRPRGELLENSCPGFFFFFFLIIYFIFGCPGSLLLHGLFSNCHRQGLFSSGSERASHCSGFSRCRAQALGHRRASVVVAPGLNCSVACGIFPDQGSNPSLLHLQVDS